MLIVHKMNIAEIRINATDIAARRLPRASEVTPTIAGTAAPPRPPAEKTRPAAFLFLTDSAYRETARGKRGANPSPAIAVAPNMAAPCPALSNMTVPMNDKAKQVPNRVDALHRLRARVARRRPTRIENQNVDGNAAQR